MRGVSNSFFEFILLTKNSIFARIKNGDCTAVTANAAVAQSVERRIGSAEVTGPIPVSSLERSP